MARGQECIRGDKRPALNRHNHHGLIFQFGQTLGLIVGDQFLNDVIQRLAAHYVFNLV